MISLHGGENIERLGMRRSRKNAGCGAIPRPFRIGPIYPPELVLTLVLRTAYIDDLSIKK
ncbi:MAG: hypothetical protein B6D36_01855 [Planctomycetes bacterium UTPLA1]|nr:MAG: hypothetical protein B6D36_01855 [Planctomycetes bacterium UTPLA1]